MMERMNTVAQQAILLVEDNADDELLTLHAFKKNNIPNPIIVVRDGAEALDFLLGTGKYSSRDTSQTPALILLDLKLPKLTGLEVLKRVRANAQTRCVPIIVLTTSAEEQDLITSYRLGANSYIQKPVDLGHFVEVIRNLGVYWLEVNCPPPAVQAP